MKTILRLEERMKKRDALNVIPVVVGDENVRFDALFALISGQQIAEAADSGAAIEDKRSAVRRGEFQAGSIAPVAPSITLDRGRRATHAPKNQFGNLLRHGWAQGTLPEST